MTSSIDTFKESFGGNLQVARSTDEIVEAILIHCRYTESKGIEDHEAQALLAVASALMWVLDINLDPEEPNMVAELVEASKKGAA